MDQRCLASTIASHQPDDTPRRDIDRAVLQDPPAPIALPQTNSCDSVRHATPLVSRGQPVSLKLDARDGRGWGTGDAQRADSALHSRSPLHHEATQDLDSSMRSTRTDPMSGPAWPVWS